MCFIFATLGAEVDVFALIAPFRVPGKHSQTVDDTPARASSAGPTSQTQTELFYPLHG